MNAAIDAPTVGMYTATNTYIDTHLTHLCIELPKSLNCAMKLSKPRKPEYNSLNAQKLTNNDSTGTNAAVFGYLRHHTV